MLRSQRGGEGTDAVTAILGSKAFHHPKPPSLICNLLRQSTRAGDLILDFFAGSGTTAQAVLELNAEDDGHRRFILVSNCENTKDEPDKNICRDVCAQRVQNVIHGYRDTNGTGGSFAYLRTHRLPVETLFSSIQHDAIWTALQLIHAESLSPFVANALIQKTELENGIVLYLPKINDSALQALNALIVPDSTLIVYAWQPGLLRQYFEDERLSFLPIPQFLVDRFGNGSKA